MFFHPMRVQLARKLWSAKNYQAKTQGVERQRQRPSEQGQKHDAKQTQPGKPNHPIQPAFGQQMWEGKLCYCYSFSLRTCLFIRSVNLSLFLGHIGRALGFSPRVKNTAEVLRFVDKYCSPIGRAAVQLPMLAHGCQALSDMVSGHCGA